MIPTRPVDEELKKALEKVPIGTTVGELIDVYIMVLLEGHGGNRTTAAREAGIRVRTVRRSIHNSEAKGYYIEPGKSGKRERGPRSEQAKVK